MVNLTSRGGILTYLLCACTVTIICTIIFIMSCSCETERNSFHAGRLPFSKNEVDKSTLPSTYLVIVIMTHANDSAVRAVIRDTWLKLAARSRVPPAFRHLFSMGTQNLSASMLEGLEEEQNLYGDLLRLDSLHDTYANLTRKTLWSIDAICNLFQFEFLLKVDSDSFVRVASLMQHLRSIAHPRLYWGFLDGRARPRRKGQWAEKEWVLCDRYLPYQLGGGYVLSYDLADFISRNKNLLKIYKSEDVSVGAWLAGLNVKYIHDPRFDTEYRSRGCNNEYLITHKQSPAALMTLYSTLVGTGKLCTDEFQVRPSYVYDWSAPPSLCCVRANGTNIP